MLCYPMWLEPLQYPLQLAMIWMIDSSCNMSPIGGDSHHCLWNAHL